MIQILDLVGKLITNFRFHVLDELFEPWLKPYSSITASVGIVALRSTLVVIETLFDVVSCRRKRLRYQTSSHHSCHGNPIR